MIKVIGFFAYLFVLIICFILGKIIVNLVIGKRKIPFQPEIAISTYLIGSIFISWIIFILNIMNIKNDFFIITIALISIFYVVINIKKLTKLSKPKSIKKGSIIIFLFILIIFMCLDIFVRSNMISDGLIIWGFRAKALYEGNILSAFFHQPSLTWVYLDYPFYIPTLEMIIYKILGNIQESSALLIVPTYYVFSGLFIYFFSRKFYRVYKSLILLIIFLFLPHLRVISVLNYSDVPLALFYMVSVVLFFYYLISNMNIYKILSVIIASNLFWIKTEGMILNIIFVTAFFLFQMPRIVKRDIFLIVIASFPTFLWLIFLRYNNISNITYVKPSIEMFLSNISRYSETIVYLRRFLKFTPFWGWFWLILFVFLIIRLKRLKNRGIIYLIFCIFFPLCIYPFIYIFSNWTPYYEHVRTSLDRLILQITPLAFILFILLLSNSKIFQKRTIQGGTKESSLSNYK
jgi:hypothetical protein